MCPEFPTPLPDDSGRALQRVTTRYAAEEDRLLLLGELQGARVVQLWLTRRLVSLLVPHLCERLVTDGQATLQTEAVQGVAQQAAMAALQGEAPVQAPGIRTEGAVGEPQGPAGAGPVPGVLVRTINVRHAEQQVTLLFREWDDSPLLASLALEPTSLRQWLGIVAAQCAAAGWALEGWPAWLTHPAPRAPASVVLH